MTDPFPGLVPTFDYLPSRDGLALVTGGPTSAGYAANALANPSHKWTPRFYWMTADSGGVLTSGDTCGYLDPEAGLGSPFAISGNDLRIRTQKASSMGVEVLDQFTGDPVTYISGFLVSEHSFSQQYGVFRVRAKVANGQNLFMAPLYLDPLDHSWPPEIDVVEYDGDNEEVHLASISSGPNFNTSIIAGDMADGGYHDFAFVWRRDVHRFYVDGVLVATKYVASHPEFQAPFYLIISPGIAGTIDGNTPDSYDLLINHVEAWQFG